MEPQNLRHQDSKLHLWTHTKVLLQDLDDVDLRTGLEFFLYQEQLSLDEMHVLYSLVLYLLEKQEFEQNIHEKLQNLTQKFANFVMKNE